MKLFNNNINSEDKRELRRTVRKLCASFAILVIVIISGLGLAFSWFSSNRSVNNGNLEMSIETVGNLIISDSITEIQKTSITSINSGKPFSIEAESNDTRYYACTHDSDYDTYSTGLKYVNNTSVISVDSGISTIPLTYDEAENIEDGKQYYVDYTVYVASFDTSLENATLKIMISYAYHMVNDEQVLITEGSLMATSIDVFNGEASGTNYVGTLNVAGSDINYNDNPTTYDATKTMTELYLVGSDSSTGTIPHNTNGYLTYTLRMYFDGALLSAADQAYIYTSNLDTSKITLGVKFIATTTDLD